MGCVRATAESGVADEVFARAEPEGNSFNLGICRN
jgi:hypothetical protein